MSCPHSSSTTKETEMASRSHQELQGLDDSDDPMHSLRLLCLSKGATGFLELGRILRRMDKYGTKTLNIEQFLTGLKDIGLRITDEEGQYLFKKFDTDGNGKIHIDEFMVHIRPPLSAARRQDITDAFNKLDKDRLGEITIEELKRVYNAKSFPRYIAGEDSEDFILEKFASNFEHDAPTVGKITKEEFFNYYAGVSASVDNDCYFNLMMRQAYHL